MDSLNPAEAPCMRCHKRGALLEGMVKATGRFMESMVSAVEDSPEAASKMSVALEELASAVRDCKEFLYE